MGYELLGVEILGGRQHSILRIYIDAPKGVDVSDCSIVSRQVSSMLDVEDPIHGKYNLEVSSPGIDRPLFEMAHFKKYVGSNVHIRLQKAIENRRQYKGILKQVDDEVIHVWVESMSREVIIPFALIEKANIIGDVHFH